MNITNFDIRRIGQSIARLRREHNMTQMQLADELGVSFQAVSNWERGQSMPDISKLPELAELFSTTIDELLGHHSPLIEKAAEGKLDELPALTMEEVTEAAPLLPPKQMDALTDRLLELSNFPDMEELLPFLSTGKVDKIARARMQAGLSIDELMPFMSENTLEEIALSRLQQGRSITSLLPFVGERLLNRLAEAASTKD